MPLGECFPRALCAIIEPGVVQGRTEIIFGSYSHLPG